MDTTATTPLPPAMELALAASFGSLERWRAAAQASAGRLRLVFVPAEGRLALRHDSSAAGGVEPALLEWAGPDAAARDAVDWAAVHARYRAAVEAASEGCGAEAAQAEGALLLDVRRRAVFEAAPTLIRGACWRDPAAVADWAAALPRDREVVVYCVMGHEVSRATALRLRAAGVRARFLIGGIEAWQAAGRALQPRDA